MLETASSFYITKFKLENDIESLKFMYPFGHKTAFEVYGFLIDTKKGLVFMQTKWKVINQNKSIPKVCNSMFYTFKFVNSDIFSSFTELTKKEYQARDADDYMKN